MELNFDFIFWAGLFAAAAPLLISFLKNLGFVWPGWFKSAVAVVMALLASFFATGMSLGWDALVFSSLDMFWMPLIGGMVFTFGAQYASYMAFWRPDWNGLETAAAGVGDKTA